MFETPLFNLNHTSHGILNSVYQKSKNFDFSFPWKSYYRTPVLGIGLVLDFTFAWDNNNKNNNDNDKNNDNDNNNDKNPHLNFLKGTVLEDKETRGTDKR